MGRCAPRRAPPPHGPAPRPITLLLARFDDLLARGLRDVIAGDPPSRSSPATSSPTRLDAVLRAHRPRVALLDVDALESLADVRDLSRRHPRHAVRAARRPAHRGRVRAAARLRRERVPRPGHAGARRPHRDPPRRTRPAALAAPGPRRPLARAPAAHAARGRGAAAARGGPVERADRRRARRSASRRSAATRATSTASSG